MKKNGIVYKVVVSYRDTDKYSSLCSYYQIWYSMGETVTAPIGSLFAFSNKADAINYAKIFYHLTIIEGRATNIRGIKFMADCSPSDIYHYWNNKRRHKRYQIGRIAPQGTVLVDSFTCDKVVYDSNLGVLS